MSKNTIPLTDESNQPQSLKPEDFYCDLIHRGWDPADAASVVDAGFGFGPPPPEHPRRFTDEPL